MNSQSHTLSINALETLFDSVGQVEDPELKRQRLAAEVEKERKVANRVMWFLITLPLLVTLCYLVPLFIDLPSSMRAGTACLFLWEGMRMVAKTAKERHQL